jgi:hypothetical protein
MASYAIEAPLTTSLKYLSLFGIGALIMRGAGCTINDMWDRNLDKAVGGPHIKHFFSRTGTEFATLYSKNSKPALGQGSYTFASSFRVPWSPVKRRTLCITAVELVQVSSVIFMCCGHPLICCSIVLGASSLSLVIVYPLMKRITYWPQAVLGASIAFYTTEIPKNHFKVLHLIGVPFLAGRLSLVSSIGQFAYLSTWEASAGRSCTTAYMHTRQVFIAISIFVFSQRDSVPFL